MLASPPSQAEGRLWAAGTPWLRHLGVGLEAPTYARGLCRPHPSLNPPRRTFGWDPSTEDKFMGCLGWVPSPEGTEGNSRGRKSPERFLFRAKVPKGRYHPASLPCLRHFIANLFIDPVTHVTGYYLSWLRHLEGRAGSTDLRALIVPSASVSAPSSAGLRLGSFDRGQVYGMFGMGSQSRRDRRK
jgi:hypothetical protein